MGKCSEEVSLGNNFADGWRIRTGKGSQDVLSVRYFWCIIKFIIEPFQVSTRSDLSGAKLSHLESLPLVVILVLVCIVTSVVSQVNPKLYA